LAAEIYASSFFDISARSRFITLVTAVETLLEPAQRAQEVQELVSRFETLTRDSDIKKATRDSILGSLQWLRQDSIGQAGRALARRLLSNEEFDGQPAEKFFARCYDRRSLLVHRGTTDDDVDILQTANAMENFVARLLVVSLADGE
jgi:Apea-like HEPN